MRIRRVESLLAGLLRSGVVLSLILLFAGMTLTMVRHPDYLTDPSNLDRLTQPGAAFPHTLHDVWGELMQGRGRAVMTVGLLVLVITPVLRVAASITAFVLDRDWAFAAITSLVLIVLLVSFALGKVE